jgi:hypothetical protein
VDYVSDFTAHELHDEFGGEVYRPGAESWQGRTPLSEQASEAWQRWSDLPEEKRWEAGSGMITNLLLMGGGARYGGRVNIPLPSVRLPRFRPASPAPPVVEVPPFGADDFLAESLRARQGAFAHEAARLPAAPPAPAPTGPTSACAAPAQDPVP